MTSFISRSQFFFFFFCWISVALAVFAGVCSFLSRLLGCLFFFFSLRACSKGLLASAAQDEVGFISLTLGSSWWESLAVVPWVYTFEAVLLEGWWPLGQRISESRTMVLDLRPALAYALTAFYTISSKFMDFRSCCSILTLMEGLRPSRK